MHFYLTLNNLSREPFVLRSMDYIHVKAKVDRTQTCVITEDEVVSSYVQEMTFDDMQILLNSWIDDENNNAETDPDTQEPIIQSYINLAAYVAELPG